MLPSTGGNDYNKYIVITLLPTIIQPRKERATHMNFIRQCILDMKGYVPGESAEDKKIIKLNQNENRYAPSAKVMDAIAAETANLILYPDSSSRKLREVAAKLYGVFPEEVMAANGSDEMLRILFQACCDPGDEAVAFYPSYTYYATLAAMQDVAYRLIDFEGEYRIPDRLDLNKAKLVFLPNPNAPTGTVFPESELRRLLAAVPNGLVVIDEAYADFSGTTALPLLKEYANLVVVRTFSKSYSLAGLRIGLGFARKEILLELEKVRDYYNLDRLAQAGAEAALLDQEWLRNTSGKIMATRQRVYEAVAAMGLKVYESGANFLLIRMNSGEDAEKTFEELRRRKVLVRYFRNRGISDCMRVTIGTDSDMDVFLREMGDIVKTL